jgi:hypothetical protein
VVSFFVREITRISLFEYDVANPNPIRADLRRLADGFCARNQQPRLTVVIPEFAKDQ